ncbi:hypothetical protein [Streptomyces rochei]|uniref:hypothetical protein n=1 Tax=Streptomyces rochei TaxID=1928 RepID=UPI004063A718
MAYADLERWWEVDFNVLASTAVAEATGPVQPSVAEALRSDDWIEQWADALYAASGELKSSVERLEYTRDPRVEKNRKRSGLVAQRVGHVNTMLRERRAQQGWDMFSSWQKDAHGAVLSILVSHYRDESRELACAEIARRGLAPQHPLWDLHCDNAYDMIEDAVQRGLINAPATPEVTSLLNLPTHALTDRVAKDVTQQEERCSALRHPLLLRRWADALEHLRDRHCELAGIAPVFSVTLPGLKMRDLWAMSTEEARTIINRRRFIRALAQRNRECQMHVRELSRTVAKRQTEVKQPWNDAVSASREELARRHEEQYKALMIAFGPFCEDESTAIRREFLGRRGVVPKELIPSLKQALADGSWSNLLA